MLKIFIVLLSALILGGCTLASPQSDAAIDQKPSTMAVSSPEPSLSTDNSDAALETDLNATSIDAEDFSDLE